MYKASVKINDKDYLACNRYYLKKYLGLKEYILVSVLLVGGLVLYFAFQQWLILLLCGITVVIMSVAIIAYLALARKGYNEEFAKRNTHEWKFEFREDDFTIEVGEDDGNAPYTLKIAYKELEKAALLKDTAYFYAGAANMFYVKYDSFTEGDFASFCEFIKTKITAEQFQMKQKRRRNRQFPYGR